MKSLTISMLLIVFCLGVVMAQTPAVLPVNFAGVQVGLTQNLPQQRLTGGMNWGHHITSSLWEFTRIDIIGVSRNPAQAQTIITIGACDIPHILFNSRLLLGWCLNGGVATSGTSIGNALDTEGLALYRFGNRLQFGAGVMGGFLRTNITPPNTPPGQTNAFLTPVRAVFEFGF